MNLGAQLYSLRTLIQTPENLKLTIFKLKDMGYQNVQFSGIPPMAPEIWAEISHETGMEIVCTHSPFDRIIKETDELIASHKIFGCSVIGLGIMPPEYAGNPTSFQTFLDLLKEPVKKIEDAGLHFAYHNHGFEFGQYEDSTCAMDRIIEECPSWHLILDTGWVNYAGKNAVEYIERIGGARLQNIHFKEFRERDSKSICPCGEGFSDFPAIVEACRKVGVKNVLVEQDNAHEKEDPLAEMKKSIDYLLPLFTAANQK